MTEDRAIKNVTVIGVGTMGREIAQVALMGQYHVTIYDISNESLNNAESFIHFNIEKLEQKQKLPSNLTARDLLNNLEIKTDLRSAVADADIVIEVIPEKLDLKQQLFKDLGEITSEHTILASNTSNMKITEIAAKSSKENKIVGMHFFTPIVILPAIELIKGKNTSYETVKIAEDFAQSLPCLRGKRKIIKIEKETPGFIVNRLTAASSLYLMWLLEQANSKDISYEKLDADVIEMQGGGLGPFAKWDFLGLDVILHSFNYYTERLSKDFSPPDMLEEFVEKGRLGKKTGEGFYEWTKEGKPKGNFSEKANMFNPEIYMAIQLNEGCRLIGEGVVDGYKEVDDAIVAAMNMPGPFSAGKRHYEEWVELLEEFVEKSGLEYFQPCELMKSGKFLEMKR